MTLGDSRKPHDTAFKQQRLKAWQPILTPKSVVLSFLAVAVVFLPIGVLILYASTQVIDAGPYRYDSDSDSTAYNVTFEWPENTDKTVYVYYQLSNFYQNHRRYVKSRSDIQLSGVSLEDIQELGNCDPWEYWTDHAPNNADQIDSNWSTHAYQLNPCGLIANSQYNDTLMLYSGDCSSSSGCVAQTWTKQGIAWKSDRDDKFRNYQGCSATDDGSYDVNLCGVLQQKDVGDEDFVVWMRTAGLPTFKKLYRKIEGGLAKGTYTMSIDQHFPVKSFGGEKAFYLSTTTWLGGKNDFLGWAYICVAIISTILAAIFAINQKLNPREIGDPRHIHWS